jgi:hypothetical protein
MTNPRSNPPYSEAQIAPQNPAPFPNKTNGNPRKIHSRKLFLEGAGSLTADAGIAHDRTDQPVSRAGHL